MSEIHPSERSAVHEASHCVVSSLLGLSVKSSAIWRPGGGLTSLRAACEDRREPFVWASGAAGEEVAFGSYDPAGCGRDRSHADASVYRWHGLAEISRLDATWDWFVAQAKAELQRHWDAVENISVQLLVDGLLSGDDVDRIMKHRRLRVVPECSASGGLSLSPSRLETAPEGASAGV